MGFFEPYRDLIGKSDSKEKSKSESKGITDVIKQTYKPLTTPEAPKEKVVEKNVSPDEKQPIPQKKLEKMVEEKRPGFSMVFIKLWALIKKDFKLIIRSRSSGLIILVGPLLLIVLVGLAFNTSSLYNLKIASFVPAPTDTTKSVIDELQGQEYTLISVESEKECQDLVRSGQYHVCVVFSENFDVTKGDSTVTYYVDESRVNLANSIADGVNRKIRAASSEVSLGYTTDLVKTLDSTKQVIGANKQSVTNLIASNSDIGLKITDARTSLESLNLTFDEKTLNITGVENAVADYETAHNSTLREIRDAVGTLKSGVSALDSQLAMAEGKSKKTSDDLAAVQGSVQGSASALTSLRDTLASTEAEINAIKVTDAGVIVEPIKSSIKPLTKDSTHLSFLFPTLIVLVVMFICILLSSTIIMKEKKARAFFRNFINPTSDFLYIAGTYLTTMILVGLQMAILLGVTMYFKRGLFVSIWPLFLGVVVIASVFIFLGMVIGYMFRTEETGTLGSIAIAVILLFFSNTILPVESLPEVIRKIVAFNPFILAESLVRKVVLFNLPLTSLWSEFLYLGVFIIVLFAATFAGRMLSKRRD